MTGSAPPPVCRNDDGGSGGVIPDVEKNDSPSSSTVEQLKELLSSHGQSHVMQYWTELDGEERASLRKQLHDVDLKRLDEDFKSSMEQQAKMSSATYSTDQDLNPLEEESFGSYARSDDTQLETYNSQGLRMISEGRVGVLLLAGGQGTRLGVDYPKGMYDVKLPSRKTLYQLQAERLAKVQELARQRWKRHGVIPWYIMTSEATMTRTKDFFQSHEFFGLHPNDVVFFEQGTLPCVNFQGKIIMSDKGKIAKAPDGNGGLYRALGRAKILDDMKCRGVDFLHVYCVDNILIKMADPVFTGYCVEKGVECAAKVVEKTSATEPVGLVCKVGDCVRVVEYSEMSLRAAQLRGRDGRLKYNCGNICIHFFTRDFLQSVVKEHTQSLVHHIAKKKIPFINNDGVVTKPTSPNGIKLEKFVFDVFAFAKKFAVWEVLRDDEFSPLKNADGADKDTPTTARHAVFNLHYRHLVGAGALFKYDDGSAIPEIPRSSSPVEKQWGGKSKGGAPVSPVKENGSQTQDREGGGQFRRSFSSSDMLSASIVCEISPLVSYSGEGLEKHVGGKSFHLPLILQSREEVMDTAVIIRRPSYVVD